MEKFKFTETTIEDLYIVETSAFHDNRGYFMETYNEQLFRNAGLNYTFVQDNFSCSKKGVLRGLHFQKEHPQAKLIRVIQGTIYDVAVDLRKNSKTYGKWFGLILSDTNKKQLLIPRGFAHGFVTISDTACIAYKCDDFYYPNDEGGLLWNDPDIGINWPYIGEIVLNDKDKNNSTLKEMEL